MCGRKGVGGVYRVSSAETVSFMCVKKKHGQSLQGEQCTVSISCVWKKSVVGQNESSLETAKRVHSVTLISQCLCN